MTPSLRVLAFLLLAMLIGGCLSTPPAQTGTPSTTANHLPHTPTSSTTPSTIHQSTPSNVPSTPAIAGSHAIASLEEVTINGVTQWLLIRGVNASNPVLLVLHGGPGKPLMPLHHRGLHLLEDEFVVVHWDQRGTGKSWRLPPGEGQPSTAALVHDTLALTDYLRERLDKEKILLLGHSWGTVLGVHAVARRPEHYAAYIGVSQVVDMQAAEDESYTWALAEAERRNDATAVDELTALGPPPYDGLEAIEIQRRWLDRFGGVTHRVSNQEAAAMMVESPEYTADDLRHLRDGHHAILTERWEEVMSANISNVTLPSEVPTYFFVGAHDRLTSENLTRDYARAHGVAEDHILVFNDSGHTPFLDEPEAFRAAMHDVLEEVHASTRA